MNRIGFYGLGKMATAFSAALAAHRLPDTELYAHSRTPEAQKAFHDALPEIECTDFPGLAACHLLFLCIKPQQLEQFETVCRAHPLSPETIVCSILAGTPIEAVAVAAGTRRVVRLMPNLAVSVGQGLIGFCASDAVTEAEIHAVSGLLAPLGRVHVIPENLMHGFTALGGSAPAFVFHMLYGLQAGGIACGFSEDEALDMAEAVMQGAVALRRKSRKPPLELAQAVCSKGGTTIEGVRILDAGNMDELLKNAVLAAEKRSKAMENERKTIKIRNNS